MITQNLKYLKNNFEMLNFIGLRAIDVESMSEQDLSDLYAKVRYECYRREEIKNKLKEQEKESKKQKLQDIITETYGDSLSRGGKVSKLAVGQGHGPTISFIFELNNPIEWTITSGPVEDIGKSVSLEKLFVDLNVQYCHGLFSISVSRDLFTGDTFSSYIDKKTGITPPVKIEEFDNSRWDDKRKNLRSLYIIPFFKDLLSNLRKNYEFFEGMANEFPDAFEHIRRLW